MTEHERYRDYFVWHRQNKNLIAARSAYIDMAAGDAIAGLFLSQLFYWHEPDSKGQPKLKVEKDGHPWLDEKTGRMSAALPRNNTGAHRDY